VSSIMPDPAPTEDCTDIINAFRAGYDLGTNDGVTLLLDFLVRTDTLTTEAAVLYEASIAAGRGAKTR
jgi:hypothetical protein